MKRISRLSLFAVLLCGLLTEGNAISVEQDPVAILAIPAGLSGVPADTLVVPVFLSTLKPIRQAQIVVEFDKKAFKFIAPILGPDANGFTVTEVFPSQVKVSTPGASDNVKINLVGDGTHFFSSSDLNILFLTFKIVGNAGSTSPFTFNPDTTATFLTTNNFVSLRGASLEFNNGSGTITNIASLGIPGGFSAPKAETLFVPVRLSSARPVGLAQMAFDFDESDIKFLDATVGAEAPGFAIFVEPKPSFTPVTPGTNKNVLITLYSGSAALSGSDKTIATLVFLSNGEIGGNSPIAFDRRANHTVLSTVDLSELTGADLAFRDGDATILPPLVNVTGSIFYRNTLSPVSGGTVGSTGPSRTTATSDGKGAFALRKLAQGSYILRPSKIGDLRNAIQGSDALLVLRAAAALQTLDADQTLCADVTRDGRVTVSDALAILRFLAAQTTGTAQAGTWIFQPETVSLLVQSNQSQNFKTFLIGDVNGNWAPAPNETQSQTLPFATVQLGPPRQEGDKYYVPLLAGKEGKVFSLLTSLEWPAQFANDIAFEPATHDAVVVTNYEAAQGWRLVLVNALGVAPEGKIGELVLSAAAAEKYQNWQLKNTEVNDWRMNITGVGSRDEANTLPAEFELQQNYPNPFNPTTTITFAIPGRAGETDVRLEIFTIDGRLVRSLVQGKLTPGMHRVQWDGRDAVGVSVQTGIYFYRIRAGQFAASRKLALVK